MATLAQLIGDGLLTRLDVPLFGGARQWRTILATSGYRKWLTDELPALEGDWGDLDPALQLDALLADFVSGARLELGRHLHVLKPCENGVWELRTTDLRVFGWFAAKNVFIGTSAGLKHQIQRHRLYHKFRDHASQVRDDLELDEPKCVYGARYGDVLSDAPFR